MKKLLAVLLMVSMLASMTACGGGSTGTASDAEGKANAGKTVEIRLLSGWTTAGENVSPDSVLYNKKIEEFNAENNGVKIINEPSAGDDKRNKALLDVTADNACDIWQFWGGSILQDYIKEDVLQDIGEYLKVSQKVKREDIPEAYWAFNEFNGTTYAVPATLAVSVFAVNKDLFAQYNLEYPKTVAELEAVSKVFAENGLAATNVGSKGGNPSHFFFSEYVMQQMGGQEGTESMMMNYTFDTPQNRKSMELMEQMAKTKVFPSDTMANGDWSPSFELFTQGKAAMLYTFNWMFTQFPEDMLDKIEIIGVPAMEGGDVSPQTFQEGWINDANVITTKAWKDESKRDALIKAFDFINYDIAEAGAKSGAIVSPNDSITSKIDYSDPTFGLLGKVMQWRVENEIEGRPNHWANCPNGELQAYFQSTLDEVWAGSITADDAMAKIQKKFDEEKANAGQ